MAIQEVLQGDKSFEDEERSRWPSEVDSNQLWAIIESDFLIITCQIAEELNIGHSTVILHLKQIGKVKKLSKWVLYELTKNQKSHSEM